MVALKQFMKSIVFAIADSKLSERRDTSSDGVAWRRCQRGSAAVASQEPLVERVRNRLLRVRVVADQATEKQDRKTRFRFRIFFLFENSKNESGSEVDGHFGQVLLLSCNPERHRGHAEWS